MELVSAQAAVFQLIHHTGADPGAVDQYRIGRIGSDVRRHALCDLHSVETAVLAEDGEQAPLPETHTPSALYGDSCRL